MEIDITNFFNNEDPYNYAASAAEMGQDAGKITWQNAVDFCLGRNENPLMLDTEEKQEALIADIKGYGAWEEEEEIRGWSIYELNALFIQMISGEMREHDLEPPITDEDWERYEASENAGRIFKDSTDGKVYYSLG